MKKTIAVILTIALLVFGMTFTSVAANSEGTDGLPDPLAPLQINQA